MRNRIIMIVMLFGLVGAASQLYAAHGADHGPETMDIKERFKVKGNKSAVTFPHWRHQEKLGQQCIKCHLDDKGGGTIRFELKNFTGLSNDFHKQFCWPCHDAMQVPKGKHCTTCHK